MRMAKMKWQALINDKRFGLEDYHDPKKNLTRTDFRRDYDRLVFSSPFRRLQNKTQVFPLPGSIFVHNRLTHSMEVACVGKSMADNIAAVLRQRHPADSEVFDHLGDIVAAACLAHDLGNPPFGHSGEKAIGTFFSEGAGLPLRERLTHAQWCDLTRFEGNANAFRVLTHQFNGRRKGGFAMTYSMLASIVKYPFESTLSTDKGKFGFFTTEKDDFVKVADELGMLRLSADGEPVRYARHPLVYIVEAADDICYQVMDIEDAHKLRILSDDDTLSLLLGFFSADERASLEASYPGETDVDDRIVYYRSCAINALERACVRVFLDHEAHIMQGTFQGSLIEHLPPLLRAAYVRCEEVANSRIYRCKEVTDVDLAGYHIIYTLLELFTDAVHHPERAYASLLLSQVPSQYEVHAPRLGTRLMAVLDFLSGMTDIYALDLYRKINGHSLPSV